MTERRLGERGGQNTVTLTEAQMPNHNHGVRVSPEDGGENSPVGNGTAHTEPNQRIYAPSGNLTNMATQAMTPNGGGGPHNNLQPFLTLNFIIALVGIYPSRS